MTLQYHCVPKNIIGDFIFMAADLRAALASPPQVPPAMMSGMEQFCCQQDGSRQKTVSWRRSPTVS